MIYINSVPGLKTVHEQYRELTKFLIKNNISITTMESCTSGFIASLITDTEGSSSIIKGAFVTYSNEAKILNGVNPKTITNYGVYSSETSLEMANACRSKYSTQIGIGITGSFGNVDPANADSVPGKVFISVVFSGKSVSNVYNLPLNITRFESKLCIAQCIFEILQGLFCGIYTSDL